MYTFCRYLKTDNQTIRLENITIHLWSNIGREIVTHGELLIIIIIYYKDI